LSDSYERTPNGLLTSILSRIASLESGLRRAIPRRLNTMGSGTALERDNYYGTPSTDADRAALANQMPQWFNTERGWWESYYAPTGTTGLTAPGLKVGTAAGWYPVGLGPWMNLEPTSAFAATAGNYVGNWNGLVRSNAPDLFTHASTSLSCHMPGIYKVSAWTTQQTGGGTADWLLRILDSSGSTLIRAQHSPGPALIATLWTRAFVFMDDTPMRAGDRAMMLCSSGSLSVHQGGGTDVRGQLSCRYVGPLLDGAD